jgi:hypothetical protein
MHHSQPFARLHVLMTAMASFMTAGTSGIAQAVTREQAYEMAGGYEPNRKTGSRTHNAGGTRAYQRAAMKRRNRARNRKAHR